MPVERISGVNFLLKCWGYLGSTINSLLNLECGGQSTLKLCLKLMPGAYFNFQAISDRFDDWRCFYVVGIQCVFKFDFRAKICCDELAAVYFFIEISFEGSDETSKSLRLQPRQMTFLTHQDTFYHYQKRLYQL